MERNNETQPLKKERQNTQSKKANINDKIARR